MHYTDEPVNRQDKSRNKNVAVRAGTGLNGVINGCNLCTCGKKSKSRRNFRRLFSRLRCEFYAVALIRFGSTFTPGPIVLVSVTLLRYVPLAAAGLARTIASSRADTFSSN